VRTETLFRTLVTIPLDGPMKWDVKPKA